MLLENWKEKGKVSKLTRWIEKDVTPVQNAAGITRTMAPRDSLTLDMYETEIPKSDVHEFYRNYCLAIDGKCQLLAGGTKANRKHRCQQEHNCRNIYYKQVAYNH